jgi:Protein of unknown function (DUF1115).
MLDLAADMNITGFVLPGKPGIVCIEGTSLDCEDWWYRVSYRFPQVVVMYRVEISKVGKLALF